MAAKKKNSRYVFGQRSQAWVKIKNYQEAEINVFGYSQKDGAVLIGTMGKPRDMQSGFTGPKEQF
ncbi:MAG: hypothetical protein H0Z24_09145 [Thermosipho sp. (in: Bacteria)]|nr:hypothetical protein [Thermosipho sp. (in: thermotogales)]